MNLAKRRSYSIRRAAARVLKFSAKTSRMRIAVIGTGVSGLTASHLLRVGHDVTVFEQDDRPGGHAHTRTLRVNGASVAVDTGFLVYNERTYPGLVRLFDRLGVRTAPSDMSFSVADEESGVEYRGSSPTTVFAQRRNLARPEFLHMLADVVRFNRLGQQMLAESIDTLTTLQELIAAGRWSRGFLNWYLVPLGSSIWSSSPERFLAMPALTLFRFFSRHGLLGIGDKPAWRTVSGGSANYVEAALAPLRAEGRLRLSTPVEAVVRSEAGVEVHAVGAPPERFDHVVVATHSDQALRLLARPTDAERQVLGAISYQENRLSLHTDERMMPRNRRAWASWNYFHPRVPAATVTMTYHLNSLQDLGAAPPLLLTLNRDDEIDPESVLCRLRYAHPVLDQVAVAAQARHKEINGGGGVSFCGAYWGNGFHEDGVQSAVVVCDELGAKW
jgi:uncharacterized protein